MANHVLHTRNLSSLARLISHLFHAATPGQNRPLPSHQKAGEGKEQGKQENPSPLLCSALHSPSLSSLVSFPCKPPPDRRNRLRRRHLAPNSPPRRRARRAGPSSEAAGSRGGGPRANARPLSPSHGNLLPHFLSRGRFLARFDLAAFCPSVSPRIFPPEIAGWAAGATRPARLAGAGGWPSPVIRGFLEVLGDLAVRRWGSPPPIAARFGVPFFYFDIFLQCYRGFRGRTVGSC
jgi:hypothetical protein